MDKNKIDQFWSSRTEIMDARIATNYRDDGRLECDINFVSRFVGNSSQILDLGAGTCTLSSKFIDIAQEIVAVEKHLKFFDLAPDHPKLKKHCSDVLDFKTNELFDVILMFGLINFITAEEETKLYKSCHSMLKKDGFLIVKNQCGVHEEVIVNGYSEALGSQYHARYPHTDLQFDKLSQFYNVEKFDIYPKEMNLWDNTHFYAFVAKKIECK